LDWIKGIFEFLKLTPKNITPFLIISSIFLFAPQEWLFFLKISDLKEEYIVFISIIFLFSSVILLNHIIFGFFSFINTLFLKRKIKKRIYKKLNNLTEDEKQILRYYIGKNTRANTLRYDDGIVRGLESDFIIYRSSSMGNLLEGFAYNINDLAWNYLNKNYHLLEGTTNYYRNDKKWEY
jgi:hypothetical protein